MTIRERPPRGSARERILDVADRLFYERGIHAVGVDTVVAESQVAKTTLYSHFRSKDDLVAAYLRRRSEIWLDAVAQRIAAYDGPARDRVLVVFDLLGEWLADPGFRGCPFINACAEFADPGHPAATVSREHRASLARTLVELCAQAEATSPDRLAAQLLLLYDAAMVSAHVDGVGAAAADNARDAAAVLIGQAVRTAPKHGDA